MNKHLKGINHGELNDSENLVESDNAFAGRRPGRTIQRSNLIEFYGEFIGNLRVKISRILKELLKSDTYRIRRMLIGRLSFALSPIPLDCSFEMSSCDADLMVHNTHSDL